jgi:hypothetical protein
MEEQKGRPKCLQCAHYDAKRNICPVVKNNPYMMKHGGIDLTFPRFAEFCSEFQSADSELPELQVNKRCVAGAE